MHIVPDPTIYTMDCPVCLAKHGHKPYDVVYWYDSVQESVVAIVYCPKDGPVLRKITDSVHLFEATQIQPYSETNGRLIFDMAVQAFNFPEATDADRHA